MIKQNFFWPIYQNIEKELIDLCNIIYIDDKQWNSYSIKIANLLIRTVIEIETISKSIYKKANGPQKDGDLLYDGDCIAYLDKQWDLSKKIVFITFPFIYCEKKEHKILKPLSKASHGNNSWQLAYQAVKHDRHNHMVKASIGNLIKSMAALYLLNIYNKDEAVYIGNIYNKSNFDGSFGSSFFATKIHDLHGLSSDGTYKKRNDFNECSCFINYDKESTTQICNLGLGFNNGHNSFREFDNAITNAKCYAFINKKQV